MGCRKIYTDFSEEGSPLKLIFSKNRVLDYYPFGMLMPNRHEQTPEYRYGFNGMEKDDEVKSAGNSYTTEFRQYDSRLGRWLSLDPLMAKYPGQSAYAGFNNNPMFFVDPLGLEGETNISLQVG